MKNELKAAFDAEMALAIDLYRKGRLGRAFGHLETAHVLGQRQVVPHVVTHWWMLKIGLKRRSASEVGGQAVRILLGALGSAVGVVPVGNTGGTSLNMFKRMPIDPSIRNLVE
ncbi:MAG TPA: DUF3703 domain-containing protein [Candidimonas sp.]|nr:DUF3703 domain-containing protein [Candidimonas sp.]